MTVDRREADVPGAATWFHADPLRAVLVAIAGITVVSGATQLVAPGFVLGLLGAERTATTSQLFATVGMFMVVVGAMLAHSLLVSVDRLVVVLWSAVQKAGAFVAVFIGVLMQLFAPVALVVAFFDLGTAVLLALYCRRISLAATP